MNARMSLTLIALKVVLKRKMLFFRTYILYTYNYKYFSVLVERLADVPQNFRASEDAQCGFNSRSGVAKGSVSRTLKLLSKSWRSWLKQLICLDPARFLTGTLLIGHFWWTILYGHVVACKLRMLPYGLLSLNFSRSRCELSFGSSTRSSVAPGSAFGLRKVPWAPPVDLVYGRQMGGAHSAPATKLCYRFSMKVNCFNFQEILVLIAEVTRLISVRTDRKVIARKSGFYCFSHFLLNARNSPLAKESFFCPS